MIAWYVLFITLLVVSCINFGLPKDVVSLARTLLTLDALCSFGLLVLS